MEWSIGEDEKAYHLGAVDKLLQYKKNSFLKLRNNDH